jgi:DNA polymerase I-like protein with 3'-5' exonuclease and polymerase domains
MKRFKVHNGRVQISPDEQQSLGFGGVAQDIYLHVAAKIPALGREIVKYYDPDHPTKEGIAAAKKLCKRDRDIAKTVQLASAYGAGPGKIHETLVMSGIDISFPDVRDIHRDYWRLFSGVKRFQDRLTEMWTANGGWIPSILGTPIPVAENLLKDIVNRFCQQSGHMVLQLWIWHCSQVFEERGLTAHPWLVDQHDEMIWEVPEDQAEAVAQAINEALASEGYAEWLADQDDEEDDAA